MVLISGYIKASIYREDFINYNNHRCLSYFSAGKPNSKKVPAMGII